MTAARTIVVAVTIASLLACSSSASSSGDENDAITCAQATSVDAGASCSPTVECPRELRCFYSAGCDNPTGTCEPWWACPDSAVLFYYCGCDGKTDETSMAPYAYAGACDAGVDGE